MKSQNHQKLPKMYSNSSSSSSSDDKPSTLPWRKMFRSTSFRMPKSDHFAPEVATGKTTPSPSSHIPDQSRGGGHQSLSMDQSHWHDLNLNPNSSSLPWQAMFQPASFKRSVMLSESGPEVMKQHEQSNLIATSEGSDKTGRWFNLFRPNVSQISLAIYVALAQATLVALILLIYGLCKLLEDYLRPVIWASLCSIPLRGIQDILVEFWSEPLRIGLADTALAVPKAVLRACVDTIIDARDVYSCIFQGKKLQELRSEKNGFLRLVRRLISFGFFVFAYEQIGRFGAITLVGLAFMFNSNLSQSTISAVSMLRSDSFRLKSKNSDDHLHNNKISRVVTNWVLCRLKTILAIGLILGLIVGSLAGLAFFSYKIGAEGKDAMVAVKSHIGIKGGLVVDNNVVQEMMDWYTTECYETLSNQIDNFASTYNLSDLFEAVKQFIIITNPGNSSSRYTIRLRSLVEKPVLNKAKCFATQGVGLSFQILASNKFILGEGANLLQYIGRSMTNFLLQATIFFWVLYYLLISESGGVTEQIVKFLPASDSVRDRCAAALNKAASGVILATIEIAIFQGCFTWLLCRLFSIHFVYMSTLLGFVSPLLPIFPTWLATLLGGVELAIDGRYVLAIGFCVTHVVVMDYGASEIAESNVPGYSTYLTGVSIIGGMTLFPSALEGAIMGPLITTVVIALKDLYTEFVLNEPKEKNV